MTTEEVDINKLNNKYNELKTKKSPFYKYCIIGTCLGITMTLLSFPYIACPIPLLLMTSIGVYKENKMEKEIIKLEEKLFQEKTEQTFSSKNEEPEKRAISYTIGDKTFSSQELNQEIKTNNKKTNTNLKSKMKTYGKN